MSTACPGAAGSIFGGVHPSASLSPSVTRSRPKLPIPRASEWSAIEADHTTIDSVNPSRTPITSNNRPNSDCPTA